MVKQIKQTLKELLSEQMRIWKEGVIKTDEGTIRVIDHNSNDNLAEGLLTLLEPYLKLKASKPKIEIPQDKIIEFNDMFPTGKAKKTGKYMRCNITEIGKSFERFFKDYDYDWPTIMAATQAYLNAEEQANNEWTLRSKYFVTKLKDGTLVSELAEWCARTLEGGYFEGNTENKGFDVRVY